ncbi:ABC transporter permease [Nocardiopsis sp. CNR-923]|uniref:ABC transporter permease n=1 Tax=Nocardiopsis sp. CNR-923 TaxID=1904965 RepID=UPI000B2F2F88|nr:ABC transporter permease [Nocardiopsis sp. CNR-923]
MTEHLTKRRLTLLTGFWTGFEFQIVTMRGQAETYFALITAPFFALLYMSIMEYSGRSDLNTHAVIAPMLMTLWTAALSFSGEMISANRENGRLELLLASPTSFPMLVFGRLCACMLLGLPSFAMSYVSAGLAFGYWMPIHHPGVFAGALLLTALATAAAATALSSAFVLTLGARIVQNTLSFPVYLLGGVIVPVSLFPGWLEGISRLVFLSWSADLLRASASPEPVENAGLHFAMLLLLGAASLAFGLLSIVWFLHRARQLGALSKE